MNQNHQRLTHQIKNSSNGNTNPNTNTNTEDKEFDTDVNDDQWFSVKKIGDKPKKPITQKKTNKRCLLN